MNTIDLENIDRYEEVKITTDPKQEPLRIDKFLLGRLEKTTRSKIQNGCRDGSITVDGNQIKPNYKVRPNEIIKIVMAKKIPIGAHLQPEDIPLNIIHEDEHLLVINKQAGLVVHPGTGNHSGTLVNGIVHYLKSKDLPILEGNDIDRLGLVHRIDKDTTGLMVIAKTELAMNSLAKQFFDHTIDRSYVALVWGNVAEEKGTIQGHIGRHPTNRLQRYVFPDGDEGKHAVTHYEVLEDLYYVTLVKCVLETGRTHQIRVHMKHLGHTLFNDVKYGGDKILKGTVFTKYKQFVENTFKLLPRQALHAKSLGFIHPATEEKMFFETELPKDFSDALAKWRGYSTIRKESKT